MPGTFSPPLFIVIQQLGERGMTLASLYRGDLILCFPHIEELKPPDHRLEGVLLRMLEVKVALFQSKRRQWGPR
jgi:hypothetical protein